MNKLQILLITLLCFGLSSYGLTGLNESNKHQNHKTPESLISAKEQISKSLEKNLHPRTKIQNIKGMKVVLYLTLDKNGAMSNIRIKDVICPPNSDETCKLIAENSLKAVKQGSPYKLPPEDYETWKDFTLMLNLGEIDEFKIPKLSSDVHVEIPKN